MKNIWIGAAILISLTEAKALPVKWTSSQVEFLAVGKPSAIKIRGQGQGLTGELQWKEGQMTGGQLTGRLAFDLTSLNTGIELRDQHMKEKYLETGRFVTSELILDPLSFQKSPCKDKLDLKKETFHGTLKLHGIEKKVSGDFDLDSEKGRGKARVRFEIHLSDYNIEVPQYLGIKVADRIENSVSLEWVCAL